MDAWSYRHTSSKGCWKNWLQDLGVFIVHVLNLMGSSDAEITYRFHRALPPNGANGFSLGELVLCQLNYSTTV